jgi:hypothetical protein
MACKEFVLAKETEIGRRERRKGKESISYRVRIHY